MRRVWLIAMKDIKEAFGRRALLLRAATLAAVLPIAYGAMVGFVVRNARGEPNAIAHVAGQIPFFAAIVVLLGAALALMVTADAIAGEKERRTIESLLATPVSDLEVFAGKVAAALLPALAAGYGGGVIFILTARIAAGTQPLPLPPVLLAAKLIVAGVPVIAAILAAIGVMVSSRCGTVMVANQVSGLLTMPVLGGTIYAAFRLAGWPGWKLLLLLAGLLGLCAVLLVLGARALGREEVIARLD